jgi:hypothetical protein
VPRAERRRLQAQSRLGSADQRAVVARVRPSGEILCSGKLAGRCNWRKRQFRHDKLTFSTLSPCWDSGKQLRFRTQQAQNTGDK